MAKHVPVRRKAAARKNMTTSRTCPYTTSTRLSLGERLWIARRRAGVTVTQMSVKFGVGDWTYKTWEQDMHVAAPVVTLKPASLAIHEQVAIARRRAQWLIADLMRETKLSKVTIVKWESEDGTIMNPLYRFWSEHGWPT